MNPGLDSNGPSMSQFCRQVVKHTHIKGMNNLETIYTYIIIYTYIYIYILYIPILYYYYLPFLAMSPQALSARDEGQPVKQASLLQLALEGEKLGQSHVP